MMATAAAPSAMHRITIQSIAALDKAALIVPGVLLAMLTLSLTTGQRVRIGKDIWVIVRGLHGNRVSIAIVAPAHVEIVGEDRLPPSERFHQRRPPTTPNP